jgi:CPA1 family monovalent cation:H+ antiporter
VIVFATILVMLAAAVVLLAVARSLRPPYPALLALAGAGVALAPVDIGLRLDCELALALYIAPVLLDAAYDTSLKRPLAPVATLAPIAVGPTTAAAFRCKRRKCPSFVHKEVRHRDGQQSHPSLVARRWSEGLSGTV